MTTATHHLTRRDIARIKAVADAERTPNAAHYAALLELWHTLEPNFSNMPAVVPGAYVLTRQQTDEVVPIVCLTGQHDIDAGPYLMNWMNIGPMCTED